MNTIAELLSQLGFVNCGGNVFQRKTGNTNLIVALRDDSAQVCHGSATINRIYGDDPIDKPLVLEYLIAVAQLAQIEERMYAQVIERVLIKYCRR